MSLLLINNNIENYSVFVSSAKEETKTLVFDPKSDTYNTILGNISALENKEDIQNVALVSHGELFDLFQLLEKEKKSWEEFTVFLQNIKKSLPEMKNFDFLGCALVSEPDWKQSLNKLESEVDFNIRASDDNTGNLKSGGDWILETDNVNIKDLYFTEAIKDYEGLLLTTVGYAHWYGREPLTMTGGRLLAAWGNSSYGASAPNELNGVIAVYSTQGAFAALKNDGSVVAWGDSSYGGSAPNGLNGVAAIYSTQGAFAALKNDGSVLAWGNSSGGGSAPNGLNGVIAIYSTSGAFAALKNDGSVVAWGWSFHGGSAPNGLNGVITIYSTGSAFAALKNDGSVVAWGGSGEGGDSSLVVSQLNGVTAIYSNFYAFAALKNDGSVVTWGNSYFGGDSSAVSSNLTSGVTAIYSTTGAFAALKNDGSVVVWGSKYFGGSLNFIYNSWGTWIENNDQRLGPALSDPTKPVTAIYSTTKAFSALRNDGSVVTWGNMDRGATYTTDSNRITNIKEIYSTEFAFAGLKYNGTVVTWGDHSSGKLDDSVLSDQSNPVTAIYSTNGAFAALKNDRSVVSWGSSAVGGSSPSGLTQVRGMYSTKYAFVAFRDIYPVQYLKTGSAGFDDDSENSDYEETETYGTFVSDTYAGPETIDSHAYVQDAILSGAILIDGDLQNMNFTNSDLTGADLTNANLRNSIFTNSDLTGAKLTGANLDNVDLSGTNLTDADLSGVLIQSTDLTNTILNFREPVLLHQDSDSIYGLPSGYACINDGDKKLIWTSPRHIILSSETFNENISSGSEIATISSVDSDSTVFTYSLVPGTDDTDNAKFQIAGNKLIINEVPNYETQSSYNIRIKTQDESNNSYEKSFTLNVIVPEITLSNYLINETLPAGTVIADISSNIQGTSLTYSLVQSHYHALFEISGNKLKIKQQLDYRIHFQPSIEIRVINESGKSYEEYIDLYMRFMGVSDRTFDENIEAGSQVGSLVTFDPSTTSYTYSLVSGQGDTDNDHFEISGNIIKIKNSPDYESKTSYNIRIRSTSNQTGNILEKEWTFDVTDKHDPPTDIIMSTDGYLRSKPGVNQTYSDTEFSLDENIPAGSEVATMTTNDPDIGDNHTYSLVSGTGDSDNSYFEIINDKLLIKISPDHETKSKYNIRLKTEDESYKTYEKSFTLYVDNIPEPPTDINLSSISFDENISAGSEIATINTVDPDSSGNFTYSLVSEATTITLAVTFQNVGGGNKYFIDGQQQSVLELIEGNTYTFNWSSSSNHPLRLSTTSDGTHNSGVEYTTGVTVDTINHTTTIIVSNSTPTLNYYCQHHAGMGGIANITTDDNNHFEIVDDKLKIKDSPDYETKSKYNITIKSEDESNNTYTEKFTLTVNDITEQPTNIELSSTEFNENISAGSEIATISTISPDSGGSFTYSLVPGTGDSDNSYFEIVNDKLLIKISPDYGTKNNYTIRLKTQTVNLLTYEKSFNLTVNNIHEYTKLTKWYSSGQVQQSTSSGHVGGAFAMSEDGNRLVLGSRSGENALVVVYKRQGNAWMQMGYPIYSITFYPSGQYSNINFNVAMSANGEKIVVADNGRDGIPFSKNFNGVVISGKIGTFRVYNFNSNNDNWNSIGGGYFFVPDHQSAKSVLGFSGDGSTVVLGGYSVSAPAAGWISTFRYQNGSYIEKHPYGQFGNILSKVVKSIKLSYDGNIMFLTVISDSGLDENKIYFREEILDQWHEIDDYHNTNIFNNQSSQSLFVNSGGSTFAGGVVSNPVRIAIANGGGDPSFSGGDPSSSLMITAVFDGDLPKGQPKGVELYVTANIDLSLYGIQSIKNGNTSNTHTDTQFSTASASKGDFIYVIDGGNNGTDTNRNNFMNWFGFTESNMPTVYYASDQALNFNGDDAVQLLYNGNVIDTFGDVNTDGTGEAWEYKDSWAYRKGTVVSSGPGAFNIDQWVFGGASIWDKKQANSEATQVMPVGKFGMGGSEFSVKVYDINFSGLQFWAGYIDSITQIGNGIPLENGGLSSTMALSKDGNTLAVLQGKGVHNVNGIQEEYQTLKIYKLKNDSWEQTSGNEFLMSGVDVERYVSLSENGNIVALNTQVYGLRTWEWAEKSVFTPPTNYTLGDIFPGKDLTGANLSGVNLRDADLSGVNLSNTDLSGINLSGADLNGVTLNFGGQVILDPNSSTPINIPSGYIFFVDGSVKKLVNTAPSDIALSSYSFRDDVQIGYIVGTLSSVDIDGTSFTYSLVSGEGSGDNGSFVIVGDKLKLNTTPNKANYSIRVRTTDETQKSYEEIIILTVIGQTKWESLDYNSWPYQRITHSLTGSNSPYYEPYIVSGPWPNKSEIKNADYSGGVFIADNKTNRGTDYKLDVLDIKFTNVKFNNANLKGGMFKRCDFEDVDFTGSDLDGISLRNCTFDNCTFSNLQPFNSNTVVDLRDATFKNCDCTGLFNAYNLWVTNTDLSSSTLSFKGEVKLYGATNINLFWTGFGNNPPLLPPEYEYVQGTFQTQVSDIVSKIVYRGWTQTRTEDTLKNDYGITDIEIGIFKGRPKTQRKEDTEALLSSFRGKGTYSGKTSLQKKRGFKSILRMAMKLTRDEGDKSFKISTDSFLEDISVPDSIKTKMKRKTEIVIADKSTDDDDIAVVIDENSGEVNFWSDLDIIGEMVVIKFFGNKIKIQKETDTENRIIILGKDEGSTPAEIEGGNIISETVNPVVKVGTRELPLFFGSVGGTTNNNQQSGDICFPAGTPVQTDQGEIAIEKLTSENTIDGVNVVAVVPVYNECDYLVKINKHALGPNYPKKTTLVSRNHRVYLNKKKEKTIPALALYNGKTVTVVQREEHETIYNVLLPTYSKMTINGLVVETLQPKSVYARK